MESHFADIRFLAYFLSRNSPYTKLPEWFLGFI
jgi:hypothetical protein